MISRGLPPPVAGRLAPIHHPDDPAIHRAGHQVWPYSRSARGVPAAMLDMWPADRRPGESGGHMAVIEVRNLAKRYGEQVALDGVSFSVEPGEIFGILGPNGAGKTTAVECMAGLRRPDSGRIRVLGL